MAKYPITNVQYDGFIHDPDGYQNDTWWEYSNESSAWRRKNRISEKTAFAGGKLPRTNVSWYDAVAFTYWLSFKTEA